MNKQRFFIHVAIWVLIGLSVGSSASAFYPARKWTFRVKPDIRRESMFKLDDLMVIESTSHTLFFVNIETGEKYWQFSFYAPVKIYPLGNGGVLVVSDNIIHKLDITNRKKLWSFRMKKDNYEKLLITSDGNRALAQYGKNSYEAFSLKDVSYPAGVSSVEPGAKELVEARGMIFNPAVAGEGTEITIDKDVAELKKDGVVLWTFKAESALAKTVAGYGAENLLFISAAGRIYEVSLKTGEQRKSFSVTSQIKMRFWDEKPESIDNYSDAGIITNGEDIFVTGPSSISRFRIMPFPESISLKDKEEDTTFGWALEKAINQWDLKNYSGAVRGMQEVVDVWPDSPEARLFLGMALSTMGKTNEAINELDKAYSLDPQNPDIISNLSGNYVVKIMSLNPESQIKKVIELYEKVRKIQPENKMAYIGLAELYIGQRNYEEAKKVIMDSFDAGFFSPDLHLLLLSAYYMEGSVKDAIQLAGDIQRLFPDIALTSLIKGKLYCKDGKYAAAVKSFQNYYAKNAEPQKQLASLLPGFLSSGHRFFYGNALGMTGSYNESIDMLGKFIADIPTSETLDALKSAYLKRGTDEKMTPAENSLMEKYGDKNYIEIEAETEFRVPALLASAHFYALKNDKKKAVEIIDGVIADGALDNDASSYAAYILCGVGEKLEDAKRMTESAVKSSPDDSVYLRNKATCLMAAGDTKNAETVFKEAISKNSETELLHYEYGKLLLKTGRKKEALEQLREEARMSPDIKAVTDILAKNGG